MESIKIVVRRRVRVRKVLKSQVRERNIRRKMDGIFCMSPLQGPRHQYFTIFCHIEGAEAVSQILRIIISAGLQDFYCRVFSKKIRASTQVFCFSQVRHRKVNVIE